MAVTSSTLSGNAVSNIGQTSVDVTFSASVTGTSIGATEVVFISNNTQYGGALATMSSIGSTSATRTIASGARTITGLSASTTYSGTLVLRGVTTQTAIRIGTAFTFTTASPPIPIPGAPTYLTATDGTYTNKIALSFGGASGTIGGFHIWWGASANATPSSTSIPDFTVATTNSYGSYENTGLSQSVKRWYWVRAYNSSGNSAWYPSGNGVAGSTSIPPAPSQTASPTLSGTAIAGTALTSTKGTYNNASTVTSSIAYDTGTSFPPTTLRTRTSPYTVTVADASNTPYNFAAVDTVVGTDGATYYYYSSYITAKLLVSFNVQNGSAVSNVSYVSNPSSPNSIQLPYTSRDGYSFNGWFTAASGGTNVGGAYGSYTPSTTANTTLYAQWTPYPPSQNWSPSLSGTGVSGTALTATAGNYNYASTVTTTIAYNTTGVFSGNEVSRPNPYTVLDSDASLPPYYFAAKDTVVGTNGTTYYYYSSATISKLKVSFNTQGGGYNPDPISYIAANPANYITLPYTYKNNYTFNGWYTAASGGTRVGGIYEGYQPSTSVSTTLYAQWTLTPISKYYGPSIYGSGISGTSLLVSSGGYGNGTYLDTKIAFGTENDFASRDGTTTDWYQTRTSGYTITDSDATTPPYYYAAMDRVQNGEGVVYYYYSSSIKSGFQITYVYNNGYGTSTQIFYSASPNPTITLPSPTKSGHLFNGWFDSEFGGTFIGNAGGSYTPPNTNIALYAQWTANSYTLTYDANGGSVSPSTKDILYGEEYGTLPTPSKPGNTFIGWYTDLSYTYQILSSSIYEEGDDSRIYAKWQGNSYVLTLYPNFPLGGKLDGFYSQNNINYGSAYGELPILTREGYSFDGWFDQAVGGTEITSETLYLLEASSDLYAHWIATTPTFTDQTITTTAYLNKDINTLVDNKVTASPVSSYSIVYSGTGLNPESWLSISKESGTNNGLLSGKPPQIGVYTFIIRASNSGSGNTDSGLITLTVKPVGKRSLESSMTSLEIAKRFDGSSWVDMKVMKRFDGVSWQDIGNI